MGLMEFEDMRPVRAAYCKQKDDGNVGALTLWQAYFLLYVAWRDVNNKGAFNVPDQWISEAGGFDAVTLNTVNELRQYLDVKVSDENVASGIVIGLSGRGKEFLIQYQVELIAAIQSYGMTAQQIQSLVKQVVADE